jgi:cell fate (sporulation/competence/biofilm development) regulator YlbF (YheA/YmcA/DUF963 family)
MERQYSAAANDTNSIQRLPQALGAKGARARIDPKQNTRAQFVTLRQFFRDFQTVQQLGLAEISQAAGSQICFIGSK